MGPRAGDCKGPDTNTAGHCARPYLDQRLAAIVGVAVDAEVGDGATRVDGAAKL